MKERVKEKNKIHLNQTIIKILNKHSETPDGKNNNKTREKFENH